MALVFLLLTGVCAWWSEQQNVATFSSFDHTHRINDTLDEILVELLNVETGNRGFAISGDEAFLKPYQAGISAVPKALAAAKELVKDNPGQQQRLAVLEPLIQEKINLASSAVQLRHSGNGDAARELISKGQGRKTMDEIRQVIVAMKSAENELLPEFRARAKKLSLTTMTIVAFGGVLSLGMVGFASFLVRRDFAKRQQADAERAHFFTVPLDMLCIIGADGSLKRVNPAFTQILGWSEDELTTRPYLELVHPEDRAATQAEFKRQLDEAQGVLQFENRCLHKDGSSRMLWWKSVLQPCGLIVAAAEVLGAREEDMTATLHPIG